MCHLHPLHLLFYVINNYNKAIVLFNNFCSVHHSPASDKGLCRYGWIFIMELCVLEVKERSQAGKKYFPEIEKLVEEKKSSFCLPLRRRFYHCLRFCPENLSALLCKLKKQFKLSWNSKSFFFISYRQGAVQHSWFAGGSSCHSPTITDVSTSHPSNKHNDSSIKH